MKKKRLHGFPLRWPVVVAAAVVVVGGVLGTLFGISHSGHSAGSVTIRMLIPAEHALVSAVRERATEYHKLYPSTSLVIDSVPPNQIAGSWNRSASTADGGVPYDLVLLPGAPKALSVNDTGFVPWTGTFWQLFGSKQVLDTLAPETADALRKGMVSWDKFLPVLGETKNLGFLPLAVGAQYDWPLDALLQHLVGVYAGVSGLQYLVASGDSASIDDPRLAAAVNALLSLKTNGLINADLFSIDWPVALKMVSDGKAGFTLLSTSLVIPSNPSIVALPFPSADPAGTEEQWVIGNLWYLGRRTSAVPEVDRFLDYLRSEGTVAYLMQHTNRVFFSSASRGTESFPIVSFSDDFERSLRLALGGAR